MNETARTFALAALLGTLAVGLLLPSAAWG